MVAQRPPYAAIFLLSAAVLSYEILLMRIFSLIQWHHFAYMMISVALLGYGAAGALVTLAQKPLTARFARVFATAAGLFGVTALLAVLAAQRVGFNALEILWDPRQLGRLGLIYGLLIVPFLCAATALCLSFTRFPDQIPRLYAADILGAATGGLGAIGLLLLLPPATALRASAALGLIAGALVTWRPGRRAVAMALGLVAGALLALPPAWTSLQPSPYKELDQTLRITRTRVLAEVSSPLGVVTAVESPQVPFRHAPGLSLLATREPPPQIALFTDGDGFTTINRFDGHWAAQSYLDFLTSALPYHLLQKPSALVLGAGGGADILQALALGARTVDAVELNPQVVTLVQQTFGDFSGRPYSLPGVRPHLAEARGFVASHDQRFDLIQVALLDAFSTAAAGLHGLAETYLYTVEALGTYLDHLTPGGLLAITRWVTLPPRDPLKLFATAVAALEARGIPDPGAHLVMIRGWKTATLLVKTAPFTPAELDAVTAFREARGFDAVWQPGMDPGWANRFNRLDRPWFYEGATALLSADRQDFLDRYKFRLTPASDDQPYFFHFFRWESLREILALKARGGLSLLEWGYPVLVATLAQALVFGALLTLLPLGLFLRWSGVAPAPGDQREGQNRDRDRALERAANFQPEPAGPLGTQPLHGQRLRDEPGQGRQGQGLSQVQDRPAAGPGRGQAPGAGQVLIYFTALGLAFMLVEIAFIQKFILFLSHPVYAVSLVLTAFLFFAGLGSRLSARMHASGQGCRGTRRAALVIAALAVTYAVTLSALFQPLLGLATTAKMALAVLIIAPLALAMGMPFPLGLASLGDRRPALVPWAWAVNGFASVVAAVLATVLAIHWGFTAVVVLAAALYLLAAATFPGGMPDRPLGPCQPSYFTPKTSAQRDRLKPAPSVSCVTRSAVMVPWGFTVICASQ